MRKGKFHAPARRVLAVLQGLHGEWIEVDRLYEVANLDMKFTGGSIRRSVTLDTAINELQDAGIQVEMKEEEGRQLYRIVPGGKPNAQATPVPL